MPSAAKRGSADAGFWYVRELDGRAYAAMEELLRGLQQAIERDGTAAALDVALEQGSMGDALRALVMRLVFMFLAEARGFGSDSPAYDSALSVTALACRLRERPEPELQSGTNAYRQCTALWRAMHYGVKSPGLCIRRGGGEFFDPELFPVLEGRCPGDPFIAAVPSVSDVVMHNVLSVLLWFDNEGKPIDWREFDPHYLGFIHEHLMGFNVIRLRSDAVRL
jgi:hypothetical protein